MDVRVEVRRGVAAVCCPGGIVQEEGRPKKPDGLGFPDVSRPLLGAGRAQLVPGSYRALLVPFGFLD
jgi:hypothetical protein